VLVIKDDPDLEGPAVVSTLCETTPIEALVLVNRPCASCGQLVESGPSCRANGGHLEQINHQ
jgi:hypothetical protein